MQEIKTEELNEMVVKIARMLEKEHGIDAAVANECKNNLRAELVEALEFMDVQVPADYFIYTDWSKYNKSVWSRIFG